MSCPDCFSGAAHEGKPRGEVTKAHGLDAYVSVPASGSAPKGIIVILPDAFGWEFVNNRLLADHYADQGYKVYLPELMQGRSASIDALAYMRFFKEGSIFQKPYYLARGLAIFIPFLLTNRIAKSQPRVKDYLETVRKAEGAEVFIGVAGFCWGGKHVLLLSHGATVAVNGKEAPLFDAGFVGHPSFFEMGDVADPVTVPLAFAMAEKDKGVPATVVAQIKEKIESLPAPVTGEVVFYQGVTHGFCVRADMALDEAKEAAAAEVQCIAWFDKHLKN